MQQSGTSSCDGECDEHLPRTTGRILGPKESNLIMTLNRKSKPHSWVLSLAITLAVATTTLTPQPAHAAFATEVTQMLNQVQLYLQQANAVKEYSEEAMRWKRTLEQYQDQLIKLQSMVTSIGLPTGIQMKKIEPENKYVSDRCSGAAGGFNLANLTKVFNLDGAGNIVKMQQEICANIQIAQNRKYNETIDMLQQSLPDIKASLEQQRHRAEHSTTSGDNDRVGSDAEISANYIVTGIEEWETRMKMYDAYIHSQQELQKVVAQIGFKGKKTGIIGTAVKTTLLQGALEVGN